MREGSKGFENFKCGSQTEWNSEKEEKDKAQNLDNSSKDPKGPFKGRKVEC